MIANLAFAAPGLLWALAGLPVLWLLLRAIPPAPIRKRFPAVALMLGLTDEDVQADKTPWWLLLLRALAIAAAIVGFAGPVLNPEGRVPGSGPLLIAMDAGWADARDWPRRIDKAQGLLEEAERLGRPTALIRLSDAPQPVVFQSPAELAGRLAGLQPHPWSPNNLQDWIAALPEGGFDTYWLSDGLAHPGREALATELGQRGAVTAFLSPRPVYALRPAGFDAGEIVLTAARLPSAEANSVDVAARGPDPAGIERELARGTITFAADETEAELRLNLPPELRNRITRFELLGQRSAGAVSLTDDSLKRRKIALIAGTADREGLQLLSPTYYLRQALAPVADLLEGGLSDVIPANPDVIILADVARLTAPESKAMLEWIEKGGLLLRFAGPRLAVSDVSRSEEDPLMPVRLREGGRSVGGAMSWGEPKSLAPFDEASPFHGLPVPGDVTVAEQVLAQPDPELSRRTIAALTDGTPLVTRKEIGAGQVVLVHVTANAEWSTLPLSGLFVQILERLAVSTKPAQPQSRDLEGLIWSADRVLDAFGTGSEPAASAGVAGEKLAEALRDGPREGLLPGVYASTERRVALNVIGPESDIAPADWPSGTVIEGIELVKTQALKGVLLTAAALFFALDVLASLWVSGRIGGMARAATVLAALLILPQDARAQDLPGDLRAIEATSGVVLAYVKTGDPRLDEVSEAGLVGLGDQLWARTAIEPEAPMAVDLETDELAFYPFLYWPISADQSLPSISAYAKLNQFLRSGGMILFDTRDAEVTAHGGGSSAEGQVLQLIASGLDIPPLEPIPQDHVLTRSFYLLQDFPGRQAGGMVWVEAAPPDAELAEGMPFRNLNDGVTPVIIGGGDWAAAWAVDQDGVQMFPVGRGYAGERQREIAFRFGINVIMHVLTGNYKSDQVHVPALLERLGQ